MRYNEAGAVAIRKQGAYYPATPIREALPMLRYSTRARAARGITVLGLVLLIILVVALVVLFTRYYPV